MQMMKKLFHFHVKSPVNWLLHEWPALLVFFEIVKIAYLQVYFYRKIIHLFNSEHNFYKGEGRWRDMCENM